MYWFCAKAEDAMAARKANPKIGSLPVLLVNDFDFCTVMITTRTLVYARNVFSLVTILRWLHNLFEHPGRPHAFGFGVQNVGIEPQWMGQLGGGVDAGQQIEAA